MTNNNLPTLTYTGASKSAVPIISESDLQTVTAEPWLKISDEGLQLEGLCFDRQKNLFYAKFLGAIFLK
ncbi:Lactonase drp35 [Staphylococcus arlettae]|nr:Lactonase drp35 [Staphylococcus arlettae]RBA03171.1 Lactonase drp35 [Staphylococcus arlettae]RBA07948.1 Lactonase drp35 [Staphylococcus arlettae]